MYIQQQLYKVGSECELNSWPDSLNAIQLSWVQIRLRPTFYSYLKESSSGTSQTQFEKQLQAHSGKGWAEKPPSPTSQFFLCIVSILLTQLQNIEALTSTGPRLLNLNQDHPQKNFFFWSDPYKILLRITSIIEILNLPNFDHVAKSTL